MIRIIRKERERLSLGDILLSDTGRWVTDMYTLLKGEKNAENSFHC